MTPVSEKTTKFLADIENQSPDVRYAAWSRAGEMDPEVIAPLGKLLVAKDPGVAKAADEALKKVVHSVGADAGGARRAAVIRGLLGLLPGAQPEWVRTIALRHLSLVGDDSTVPVVAKLLADSKLQEEAVFCLERIPGKASTAALIQAVESATNKFQPRLLAALGHRGAEEATEVCAAAMTSSDLDVAMAGFKAVVRIGKKPTADVRPPKRESLSAWQLVEFVDGALRYADVQVKRGNLKDAFKIYTEVLQMEEEHLQCAAMISIGKSGVKEAVPLIEAKLKSGNSKVRITAGKALAALKA